LGWNLSAFLAAIYIALYLVVVVLVPVLVLAAVILLVGRCFIHKKENPSAVSNLAR